MTVLFGLRLGGIVTRQHTHAHAWNPRGGLCAVAPQSLLATTSHAGWPTFLAAGAKLQVAVGFKLRSGLMQRDNWSIWRLGGLLWRESHCYNNCPLTSRWFGHSVIVTLTPALHSKRHSWLFQDDLLSSELA